VINVLIIEDEIPARRKLKRFLQELEISINTLTEIDSVSSAIDFLNKNKVDVIFSDIELLDGNAFNIYAKVSIDCPIIFTTAYDQFWMNAFESNGIEYLLKPFSKDRFEKAWNKFLLLSNSSQKDDKLLTNITKLIQQNLVEKTYKKRFSITTNKGVYFLDSHQIAYFEASEGVIFAHDNLGSKHLLTETTIKDIENQVDPLNFFRINRSELIQKEYVEKIERYSKNSIAIKLKGYHTILKTSQNSTSQFKNWIEK
jgi:DNA-binding LytR/AlgR family response regulator